MALPPTTPPETDQRQLELPPYLTRTIQPWITPNYLMSKQWRRVVRQQAVAIDSRDYIIDYVVSLPWRIEAKDTGEASKYKTDIQYYTDLFEDHDGGYQIHAELVMQDALDLPFGGCTELGREGDQADGRVMWYKRMDGGTLFPTYSPDWPVGQRLQQMSTETVYFPEHALSRAYYTPRTEIDRAGWGMAPPEKLYLAIQLLYRGDAYYANLLIDTPEAGILDLGDMEKESARSWLASWQALMYGTEAFKVPVLYEHTTVAKYIPFGRSPVEMSYQETTLRYAQLVASGYGVTLADIGLVEGDTASLAGTIRGERRTKRSGIATAKKKLVVYWQKMLPSHLRFVLIDQDDELLVSKGRARLANSMALTNLVKSNVITKQDAQEQLLQDGLLTVSLEEIQDDPLGLVDGEGRDRFAGNFLANPVPASDGGEGEISARALFAPLIEAATLVEFQRLSRIVERSVGGLAITARNSLKPQDLLQWRTNLRQPLAAGIAGVVIDVERSVFDTLHTELKEHPWWALDADVLAADAIIPAYEETINAIALAIRNYAYVESMDTPAIVPRVDIILDNGQVIADLTEFVNKSIEQVNIQIMQLLSHEVTLATLTELSREQPGDMAAISRAVFFEQLGSIARAFQDVTTEWIRESVMEKMVPGGIIPDVLWSGG